MNFLDLFATSNINSMEVLKNLPDAVIVVEADKRISWVNYKTLRMFHCFERDLIELPLNEILVDGTDAAQESFYKHKSVIVGAIALDGYEFFAEITAKKYEDQFILTLRDVTQLTNVYSDVEKTGRFNKEKNLMLYKLANDFKSPLQTISGFSKALKDGLCGDINEKQLKYLEIINKNARDLNSFLEKFFEFSYVESTLFKPDAKIFDCLTVLQNVLKEFELELSNKKLSLDFKSFDLEKKIISCDENSFKSIIKNLLEIAISSTETGIISVKISNPDLSEIEDSDAFLYKDFQKTSYIKLEIKDTGTGFSETDLKTIFDPYVLLDTSNKKAISRAMVFSNIQTRIKRLKGSLRIASEVMKGSTYTVILPVEKDKEFDYE